MFGWSLPGFKNMINNNPNNLVEQNSMTPSITIETQDSSGNWRVHGVTLNHSAYILDEMNAAQAYNNGARVHAIDNSGRVVDIL